MAFFSYLLLGFAVYYAALMGAFAWGFRRVRDEYADQQDAAPASLDHELPFVSVIVCARDEEATIAACLESILQNDYPRDRFEIIVVDDFSTDATAERVQAVQAAVEPAFAGRHVFEDDEDEPPIHLLRMQDVAAEATGHKHDALLQGIASARGEVIATTDADCRVGPGWLRAMMGAMSPEVGFVAGPVRYHTNGSLADRVQALEFMGLIAVGAGAVGIGRPNMCNSANIAYRRDVLDQVRTDERAAPSPAEDEVLLQRVARETEWHIAFCAAPHAVVTTEPLREPMALFRQRMRWAGAGARYPSPFLVAAIAGVWIFYALLLAALVATPFAPALLPAVLASVTLKAIAEAALLRPAVRHFGQKHLFRLFLPTQLVQIPYVVAIGAAGVFGRTVWKGRSVT